MTELLLNPNIAYLLIVAGFLLTVFAILTPGTGLFELGAVFVLFFVGWQIFNLPVNAWALVVLLASVVPFIFAIRGKRETMNLGLTAAAFVLGSVFMFRGDPWYIPAVNPVLAFVVSILGGGFFYVMTQKVLEARGQAPTHDLSGLIGAVGEARTGVHLEGSVYVKGELWTAHSKEPIENGSEVRVLSRSGFMLEVEALDNDE